MSTYSEYRKLCDNIQLMSLNDDNKYSPDKNITPYHNYLPLNPSFQNISFEYVKTHIKETLYHKVKFEWLLSHETDNDVDNMFGEFIVEITQQRFSNIFGLTRSYIEETFNLDKSVQSDEYKEFDKFSYEFIKQMSDIYTSMISKKKTLDSTTCTDDGIYIVFDWLLLYVASFQSLKIFMPIYSNTIFGMLSIQNQDLYLNFLHRKPLNCLCNIIDNILIYNSTDGFKFLIDTFGITTFWDLVLSSTNLNVSLICIVNNYCEKLFACNLLPDTSNGEYDYVMNKILSYKDLNGQNFFHYLVIYSLPNNVDPNNTSIMPKKYISTLKQFSELKHQEDKFGFLPIIYTVKYLYYCHSKIPFTNTKNIIQQINYHHGYDYKFLELTELSKNAWLFFFNNEIFEYSDLYEVKNNISLANFEHIQYYLKTSKNITDLELIENANSLIYNFKQKKYFKCKLFFEQLLHIHQDSCFELLTKKIYIREFNMELQLFIILGMFGVIERLLYNDPSLNFFNTIRIIFESVGYIFNFGLQHDGKQLINTLTYDQHSILNNNIDALIYDQNNIHFNETLSIAINTIYKNRKNIDYIFDYLESTSSIFNHYSNLHDSYAGLCINIFFFCKKLSNKNLYLTLNKNQILLLIKYVVNLIGYDCDNDYNFHIIKYSDFLINNYFEDYVQAFVESMKKIYLITNNDYIHFPQLNNHVQYLSNNLCNLFDTNEEVFVDIISKDCNWHKWISIFNKNPNKFLDILNHPNCDLQPFDENDLSTHFIVFFNNCPELFNILLKKGFFDNTFELYVENIANIINTFDFNTITTLMNLPNFDPMLIIDKINLFITTKLTNNIDNLIIMEKFHSFIMKIIIGFLKSPNHEIFVNNNIYFDDFSKLFIQKFATHYHNFIDNNVQTIDNDDPFLLIYTFLFRMKLISNKSPEYTKNLLLYLKLNKKHFYHTLVFFHNCGESEMNEFLNLNNTDDNISISWNMIFSNDSSINTFICKHLLKNKHFCNHLSEIFLRNFLNIRLHKTMSSHIPFKIFKKLIQKKILNLDVVVLISDSITFEYYKLIVSNYDLKTLLEANINIYTMSKYENFTPETQPTKIINYSIFKPSDLDKTSLNIEKYYFLIETFKSQNYKNDKLFCHNQLISELSEIVICDNLLAVKFLELIISEHNFDSINQTFIDGYLNLIEKNLSNDEGFVLLKTLVTYIDVCDKNNIKYNNKNKLLKICPEIIIYFNDFEYYLENLEINELIKVLNSPFKKITLEQQDVLLKFAHDKYDITQFEQILLNIKDYSNFCFTCIDKIKTMCTLSNALFQKIISFQNSSFDLLYLTNNDGDFLLTNVSFNYITNMIVDKFVNNITIEQMCETNRNGHLRIFQFLQSPFIEIFFKRNDINNILTNDKIGHMFLTSLLENIANGNNDLSLDSLPDQIIDATTPININGNNFYMALFDLFNDTSKYTLTHVFNKYKMVSTNNEYLLQKNNDGNNLLFLSSKHSNIFPNVFTFFLEKFGPTILNYTNNCYETLLMFAIKHNPDIINFLLKNPNITDSQNYVYINKGSVLTYAISTKTNEIINSILKWKYLSHNHMDITQQITLFNWISDKYEKINISVLGIMSLYSPEIFGNMLKQLNLEYINNHLIHFSNSDLNLVKFTYLYQPLSFQNLCVTDVAINFNSSEYDFFLQNAIFQPYSWFIFLTSKKYKNTIYSNLPGIPKKMFPSCASSSLKYSQTTNEIAENLSEKCEICIQNKKKIMYGCKIHFACVCCVLKSGRCPFCRNNSDPIKIFD